MLAMATAKAHEHGWSERDSSVRGPDDETKDDDGKGGGGGPNAAMTMAFTQVRAGTVGRDGVDGRRDAHGTDDHDLISDVDSETGDVSCRFQCRI